MYHSEWYHFSFLKLIVLVPPLLSITSGSSWLYVEWNAQPTTFRVLYRGIGAPDYQVIVSTTSQLSHNISALQPNTLYSIVVEATHTETQQKVNSSVTRAYTTPQSELKCESHQFVTVNLVNISYIIVSNQPSFPLEMK